MKDPIHYILTDRQLEIFELMAIGDSTKDIGHKLHISIKTVYHHQAALCKRLNIELNNIALLTHFAIAHKIVSLIIKPMPTRKEHHAATSAHTTQTGSGVRFRPQPFAV